VINEGAQLRHHHVKQNAELRGEMPVDPGAQCAGRQDARVARDLTAAVHEDHGREPTFAALTAPFSAGTRLSAWQSDLRFIQGMSVL
jgi:hypothetical protein